MATIRVQEADFDAAAELAALQIAAPAAGAIGSFIGIVRSTASRPVVAMTLEHYPAMTQAAIARIAGDAAARFDLQACTVVHRFGRLLAGERIVFVGAAASHRTEALLATQFLIDWLKTRAPFWKREEFADGGTAWVEALDADTQQAATWP